MSHSASHRRRKGADSVNTYHNNKNNNNVYLPPPLSPSPDSKRSKGFWSYFQRAAKNRQLRRGGKSDSDRSGGDTLLPTTFKIASPMGGKGYRKTTTTTTTTTTTSSNSSSSIPFKTTTPTKNSSSNNPLSSATKLCVNMNNSFMMGGIDKRRYRRKPKGILWRIFWSSVPRRLCVSFFFLYLAVFHLLVPLGIWLVIGETTTGTGNATAREFSSSGSDAELLASLVHSAKLNALPSIQQERKYLGHLQTERDALEEHGSGKTLPGRWKILEQIAPEWFHRFDSDVVYKKYKTANNAKEPTTDDGNDFGGVDPLDETAGDTEKGARRNEKDVAKVRNDGGGSDANNAVDATVIANNDKNDNNNNNNNSKHDAPKDTGNSNKRKTAAAVPTKRNKRFYQKAVSGTRSDPTRRHLIVTGGIADELQDGNGKASNSGEDLLLPLRTLHNMQELGNEYSSCGVDSSNPLAVGGGAAVTTTQIATTLVVQTSIERMWILRETCSRWTTDPIVTVVFVPHSSTFEEEHGNGEFSKLMNELEIFERRLLLSEEGCPNLTLVRYEADRIESLRGRYPVNRLRNIGLDLVRTSHVLVMDVDFVPSTDLDILVKDAIRNEREAISVAKASSTNATNNNTTTTTTQKQHRALVVPAFEKNAPESCSHSTDPEACLSKFLKTDGAFLPKNFAELRECSVKEECVVFQSKNNWDGHSTTLSKQWMQKKWYEENEASSLSKNFRRISCFHTARYEPYIVLEWCPIIDASSSSQQHLQRPLSPYYDERFYGYGKNKIELVSHLRLSGVRFEVLPEGFLVHNPHAESSTKEIWLNHDQTSDLHATMDAMYRQFLNELFVEYESVRAKSTKLCETTKNGPS